MTRANLQAMPGKVLLCQTVDGKRGEFGCRIGCGNLLSFARRCSISWLSTLIVGQTTRSCFSPEREPAPGTCGARRGTPCQLAPLFVHPKKARHSRSNTAASLPKTCRNTDAGRACPFVVLDAIRLWRRNSI